MAKNLLLVVLLSVSYITDILAQSMSIERMPDEQVQFPGGNDSLRSFTKKRLKYPLSSWQQDSNETMYLSFIVGLSGIIDTTSIIILKSLGPSFEKEAKRFIKILPKLIPAKKNGILVISRYVLPLNFEDDEPEPFPAYFEIEKPIMAIVKQKPGTATYREVRDKTVSVWSIYEEPELENIAGRVSVGDTVYITGWDYKRFFIEKNGITGYIPTLALSGETTFETVLKTASNYSNVKTFCSSSSPDVMENREIFLDLKASRKSVYINECADVTVDIHISAGPTMPYEYHDLDKQMRIWRSILSSQTAWFIGAKLDEIRYHTMSVRDKSYWVGTILTGKYCPTITGDIVLPIVSLNVKKKDSKTAAVTLIKLSTAATTIHVKPLPMSSKPSAFDFFQMVGSNYVFHDTIASRKVDVGQRVLYQVTLTSDNGIVFPIGPMLSSDQDKKIKVERTSCNDTIMNGRMYFKRSFLYSLVFNKPGIFDLGEKASYSYFNPLTGKIFIIKSAIEVVVVAASSTAQLKDGGRSSASYPNLILMDVSRSMAMEDYKPNRLEAVRNGLERFLLRRKSCDIGLFTYSENSKPFVVNSSDSCYSKKLIRSINFMDNEVGTAIGDAVWTAKQALTLQPGSKLVIIGDGDITAGACSIFMAAALAKKYRIKVYSIGVGIRGPVDMGKDVTGKAVIFETSYEDKDLKYISAKTGGKFFWAKDSADLMRILNEIFP